MAEFEGLGIDISKLKENTKVAIFLGTVGSVKATETYKDAWNESKTRQVNATGVICKRKLTLLALGDGRFLTKGDTLLDSASVYDEHSAIPVSTKVVLGHKIHDNGQEILEQRLAADDTLYYDDDTTDTKIASTYLPIADVTINGISARGIQHVEMVAS